MKQDIYKESEETINKLSEIDMSKSYTYADYLTWQFDEMVELIRGKVFKMSPAPGTTHQKISLELCLDFGNFFRNKLCQLFVAPFDVRFPNKNAKSSKDILTIVQPDLSVICDENKIDERGCLGAPDLIVEILSPSNSSKDLKLKYKLYEEFGVKEYWLVYPYEESVHVYNLKKGNYQQSGIYTREDKVISPLFPQLEVDLSRVFKENKK